MFAIIFLLSALGSSSSTPVPILDDATNPPFMVLGRELPQCMNIARFRTLQEIVWSCLVTIFACTWLAIHPNLPGPYDCAWTRLKRKVTIMVYAILAPELVTMWAMRQWFLARKIAREFNEKDEKKVVVGTNIEIGEGSGVREEVENGGDIQVRPETTAHIKRDVDTEKRENLSNTPLSYWTTVKQTVNELFHDGPRRSQSKDWTVTHGFFLQMGGFMLCNGEKPLRVLEVKELRKLVDAGKVDIPRISEDEINDKSKGDFLTKLFVVLQTTWFIVQCLTRWITHLPVTELEVITLAFATLNIITYGLWWKKPQNILVAFSVPMKFGADSEPQPREEREGSWIIRKLRDGRNAGCCGWVFGIPWRLFEGFLRPFGKLMGMAGEKLPENSLRVPMFYIDGEERDMTAIREYSDPKTDYPTLAIGFLFGALHLIPWSSDFPSNTERWLWRSSALVVTIQPVILTLYSFFEKVESWLISAVLFPAAMLYYPGIPLYFVARFILLVLAFTTLRTLPHDAYANIQWTTFVPHV